MAAVGLGDHLHTVAGRVEEVDAPAAVVVVDLPDLLARRVGEVGDPGVPDPLEDPVELLLGDQERVVLQDDLLRLDGGPRSPA
ncbi:MAG: hypothetical protein ACRDRZ_02525 [Pseudonocardiaceae bacterium]